MMYLVRLVAGESGGTLRGAVASHKTGQQIFDWIVEKKADLQDSLEGKGKLLYLIRLGKKARRGDVSVCLHLSDLSLLGEFVTTHLASIPGVSGIRVVNLIDPVFYPLPKDTRELKRFVMNIDVSPTEVRALRDGIMQPDMADCVLKSYIAFKFSGYDSSIQFSVLSKSEHDVNDCLAKMRERLPAIRNVEMYELEATHPMLSYDEWKSYSAEHSLVTNWDDVKMMQQFQ